MATTKIEDVEKIKEKYNFLYPLLSQPDFNIKIAEKREFDDTKYPEEVITDIKKQANFLCNEKEFELMPHQKFVRNFLSSMTPYNGVLLYHGLGTGKTCTAISVAEQTREYYKHLNSNKKILIIASPNVKENFKTQLFDSRKLKKVNGVWNLRACTGKTYLREINPMSMKNMQRRNIIKEVNKIIRNSYRFLGYTEFANIISKILSTTKNEKSATRALRKHFSDTLIIIDEVHNIRHTAKNPKKRVAINLLKVVKAAQNLKLLFLSATPMYNSHDEIIWLLNILNINDGLAPVLRSEIFDKKGEFIISDEGEEVGKKYLASRCIGYISYLRGQNPYTFPYRLWPKVFSPKTSLVKMLEKSIKSYPSKQINGEIILEPPNHLDVYLIHIQKYQNIGYNALVEDIKKKLSEIKKADAALGYEMLSKAIQGLNIIYPYSLPIENPDLIYGESGLKNTMLFSKKRTNFKYRNSIIKDYGRIFSPNEIGKYSNKINTIMERIRKSEGIIMIYSQYISAGCVPLALALEEMGIQRYGRKSLFKTAPHDPVDYRTLKPKSESGDDFIPATYAMITGDNFLSPGNNKFEMSAITGADNINGEIVKVVIISRAGAEGLDFKNIRQVHVLEPWYNLNRIEQVIGRAVRTCSHKALEFSKRNVELYLYGSLLSGKQVTEAADLYIYRKAYDKAVQIGRVSRLLKENAIDCYLNINYNNLSINKKIKQQLSSKPFGKPIDFNIKSKPYSSLCDYMEKCKYNCVPVGEIREINDDTYNERFIVMNMDKIVERIRSLMKEQFLYKRTDLIARIRVRKDYPLMQINEALSYLIDDKNEFITDMFGRLGNLVNIGEYYMFQPIELENIQIPYFERTHPISYKRPLIDIRKPITKSKKSVMRNLMDRLDEYQMCVNTSETCNHIEYSETHAAISFLSSPPFNISRELLKQFMYSHIFDSLSYVDKLELLNILWEAGTIQNDFKQTLKSVVTNNFVLEVTTGQVEMPRQFILPVVEKLANRNIEKRILILKDKWVLATKTDLVNLGHMYDLAIEDKYQKTNISNIIGFMGTIKGSGFKFKVIDNKNKTKRNRRGFQCVTQQKQKTLDLLNRLMKTSPNSEWKDLQFTEKNTKEPNNVLIPRGFSRHKLCNVQELILRYYNYTDHEQTWFLSSFGAKLNKIEE